MNQVETAFAHVVCPTLVGRERELQAIAALVESSAEGRCEMVLVAGEAGVGKTRLLREAREGAATARTLWGGCLEQQRSLPYAPVAEALRRVQDELDDPVLPRLLPELDLDARESAGDSEVERHRIAQALAALMAKMAQERPLLVVLEDLHWADAATVDLLPVLVRRLADEPVLVVASYRSDELHDRPDVTAAVAELKRRRAAHELRLAPLDAERVEEMIRATVGAREPIGSELVASIAERADGNPFFVEELLRTLLEAGDVLRVPPTIQDAILRRVARLDDPGRSVLRLGAVLGHRFDLEPVRRLCGLDEDELMAALRSLVDQQLLVEDPASGELAFRHALTRDTVYAQLLVAERRALHREVAGAIEELRGASAAAELALHYEAAGDSERARGLALQAGRRAAGLGALGDARTHFLTALRLAEDDAERPQLLRTLGRLSFDAGLLTTAIAELREAIDGARRHGDRRAEAGALLDLSGPLLMHGERAAALDARMAALRLLEPEGDSEELAWAYRALGHHHMLGSSSAEAIEWSRRAIELAGRVGAEEAGLEARNDLGTALALSGDPDGGLPLLRECVETAKARGWAQRAGRAYVNLGHAFMELGRIGEAADASAEGAAYCERAGAEFSWFLCRAHLAECRRRQGKWQEADGILVELLGEAEQQGSKKYRLIALEGLGLLRADQGRWRDAHQLAERLRPLAVERDELQHLVPLAMVSARAKAAAGRPGRALRDLEALDEYAQGTDDTILMGAPSALACELADGVERARWLERVERAAVSPVGEARLEESRGRFERAAAGWGDLGRPYDRARALRRLGESLVGSDPAGARAALDEARAIAAELGAAHERTLAEAALRRAGVRVPRGPRASTRSAPGGLTARELEVARLIGDGATNAEIAGALVIAPKTAAAHVSHILTKLGYSSRAQVARWVAENDAG